MSNPTTNPDRLGYTAALLVLLSAVPLAAFVTPNTISSLAYQALRDLGLPTTRGAGLIRAGGLAVPGLLAGVPLGAIAARRAPAWLVALAGAALAGGAELGALSAASVPLIGALRVAEGIGAGLALPASLVLIWRHGTLRAVWAGVLAGSMIMATPLMLVLVPASGTHWRTVLQPGLLEIGVVLGAVAVWGILRGRRWKDGLPAFRTAERTQLLLPVVPATGFAVLAVVTSYDWSEGARYVVAGVGLAALLGLAVVGTRDAVTGSPLGLAVIMVSTGVFGMQVATPLAGLLSTKAGPQHVSLIPFVAGAAAALAGALLGWALHGTEGRNGLGLVIGGHGLIIMAVMVLLATDRDSGLLLLSAPMTALGAGIGLALGAALRGAGLGAALFGLGLLFPAVLTGQLAVGTLQVARVNAVLKEGGGMQAVSYALTGAFREWLIVAGMAGVLITAAVALAAQRHRRAGSARTTAPRVDAATPAAHAG